MGTTETLPKASPAAAALKWVLVAVVLAALLLVGRQAGGEIPRFAAWVESLGAIGPLVFIVGYAIAVVAFVPASLLTLAAGAIFGIPRGVAFVFCAAVLGSSMAFLVARYVARSAIENRLAANDSFAAIDRAIALQGRRIVFLLRLSPAFPFTLLNYALGLTRVRFADYVVASVGMLPGTLLYVYYGKLAGDVAALAGGATVEKDAGYWGVLVLGLVATVAVTALVTRTARRALAEATTKKAGAAELLSARAAIEKGRLGPRAAGSEEQIHKRPVTTFAVPGHTTKLSDLFDLPGPVAGAAEPPPATERRDETTRSQPAPAPAALDPSVATATATPHAKSAEPEPAGLPRGDRRDDTPVTPADEHNARLLGNVRPSAWIDPAPAGTYDLVVVGAGSGGLISAAVAAGLGARVALVEKNLMGGDCLNTGCVPSKAVIRHARRVAEARALLAPAVLDDETLDRAFEAAMRDMRRIRADISADDSAARYRDELGCDVFLGEARFSSPTTIKVGDRTLTFRKAVVASGASAVVPPVRGLAEVGYLTNETVFNLEKRPRRLTVIGAGPIGCELAQAMRRLGCEVTLVDRESRILPREDEEAAAIVKARLEKDGVRLALGAEIVKVDRGPSGRNVYWRLAEGGDGGAVCDEILVAIGRRANVEGLGLEVAGIEFTERGVRIDDNLRTTNPRVFAVGDCCLPWQFTHAADASAKLAVQNALFFGRKKLSDLVMPRCTFTDPEVAHVGLDAEAARVQGLAVDTLTVPLEKVNRAVCDGEAEGFVRVLVKKGTDKVVGATVVASHAGEMIGEIALAITGGLGLAKVASVIHPYPTQAEGIKAAANAYMRTKLTPLAKRVLGLLLRVQR